MEILRRWGFEVSICSPPVYTYGHGACGVWIFLFIYSKYFELLDTVFIILRKRPLNFLHWYHHATVLLYTWDGYCVEQPAGIYFVAMNYSVHAVMYFYYFLASQLQRPLSWGIFVTIAQISQMFVGVGVTCVSLYYSSVYTLSNSWKGDQFTDPLTHGQYINTRNLVYGLLMYSTYFYLFAEYFVKRYVLKKKKPATPASTTTSSSISSGASASTGRDFSSSLAGKKNKEEVNKKMIVPGGGGEAKKSQ